MNVAVDEQRLGNAPQRRVEREWRHDRDEVGLLFGKHGPHRRKRGLQHDVVAFLFETASAQHRADCNVNGAAACVDRHDLALEVFDFLDRAVGQHHVLLRIIVGHAILEFVGDHPQVIQVCILMAIGSVENARLAISSSPLASAVTICGVPA